jgi:hypothetical protein
MHSEEPMNKPKLSIENIEDELDLYVEIALLSNDTNSTKDADEMESQYIRLLGMIDGYAKQCALEAEARTRDELLRRSV